MFGAILALLSAAFFGLNNATVRRGVIKATVLQGMAITVPLGVPIIAVFGTVALTMDIRVALDWLPLSPSLEAILSWEWAL